MLLRLLSSACRDSSLQNDRSPLKKGDAIVNDRLASCLLVKGWYFFGSETFILFWKHFQLFVFRLLKCSFCPVTRFFPLKAPQRGSEHDIISLVLAIFCMLCKVPNYDIEILLSLHYMSEENKLMLYWIFSLRHALCSKPSCYKH